MKKVLDETTERSLPPIQFATIRHRGWSRQSELTSIVSSCEGSESGLGDTSEGGDARIGT